MGLLDQLWDDTVAGSRPDTGLSRLRKQFGRPAAVKINGECALGKKSCMCHCLCQFAALLPPKLTGSGCRVCPADPAGEAAAPSFVPPSPATGGEEMPVKVTRSIMIKRPAGCPASPRSAANTPPASPAGSTPPISPFSAAGECPQKPFFSILPFIHSFICPQG
jgi:hypothetical protein